MPSIKTATWEGRLSNHSERAGRERPLKAERTGLCGKRKADRTGGRFHCPRHHHREFNPYAERSRSLNGPMYGSAPSLFIPLFFRHRYPFQPAAPRLFHSIEEICSMIGADSLGYLKIEDLPSMTGNLPLAGPVLTGSILWRLKGKKKPFLKTNKIIPVFLLLSDLEH